MRDKNRIHKILNELEKVWKSNPDLRLGQIMVIATRPKTPCPAVFNIEDDEMMDGIRSIGKKVTTSSKKNKRIPYWELYPELIRISIEQITPELITEFIDVVRRENGKLILTPTSMMALNGAPVTDIHWLKTHKERIEKIKSILSQLQKDGLIEAVEIGYQVKK